MDISHKALTVLICGIVVTTLLAFLVLSGLAATAAWMGGSGNGSGPLFCQPTTPGTASTTPSATAAAGGTIPTCVPPSNTGAKVVVWAKAMADALYVNPACGGQISYPNCYDTWYKAPGTSYPSGAPTFPAAVIQYGNTVCPGCSAWANGSYQCVSFVRGAYSQVYPMRLTANAFDLWAVYATQLGWMEIPAAAASAGQRGIPLPGDVMVFKDASIGHVSIVMSVELPTATMDGVITFSNANSVSPYTTMPLLPDLTVDAASWPGYTVWGYIRPAGGSTAQVHATLPSSGQNQS